MTAANWKLEIATRIEDRENDVDDRAGRTEFSQLAHKLRSLACGTQDDKDAAVALKELMDEYVSNSDVQRLDDLSQLITLAEFKRDSLALNAYRLWGIPTLAVDVKIPLLAILCSLGRRLTPTELTNETLIRAQAASLWIDASTQSQPIQYWARHVTDLLTSAKLTPAELFVRLPAWYQRFGHELIQYVAEWEEQLPMYQRGIFRDWITERDVQYVVAANASTSTSSNVRRNLLAKADTQFIGAAYKSKARKLNGRNHPDFAE